MSPSMRRFLMLLPFRSCCMTLSRCNLPIVVRGPLQPAHGLRFAGAGKNPGSKRGLVELVLERDAHPCGVVGGRFSDPSLGATATWSHGRYGRQRFGLPSPGRFDPVSLWCWIEIGRASC